jgi:cellulose synthase/poly-beta-1,6-N-acetylglucosamine synthase-like glycosyltransferase
MSDGWLTFYAVAQGLYFLGFLAVFYFLVLPVDRVDVTEDLDTPEKDLPFIILAYPVLREDVPTMTSTLISLTRLRYPRSRYRIIAIPNTDDRETVMALRSLRERFEFLEVMEIPATTDPSWDVVWRAWDCNPKAYWFHQGATQGQRDLPPKKTRQLIYLFYTLVEQIGTDWVLDYIDADSMPPPNHFRAAAVGLKRYPVVQATNIAGNLLDSMPASLHAFDHMCWDGYLHPHMSAHGAHPFYVLGKGQFYRASDLQALGGFNPWITIEDPEIGIRLWANGRRIGIVDDPLKEEVPRTVIRGIIQRKRWVCGFFQTLGKPLEQMGLPFWRRMQARLNILPVLSLAVNVFGLPTGAYALYLYLFREGFRQPFWLIALAIINIAFYVVLLGITYTNAWQRSRLVLNRTRTRLWYMLRVNPLSLFIYHTIWTVPIVIGFAMFIGDRGKVWVRTQKFDRLHRFVEDGWRDRK